MKNEYINNDEDDYILDLNNNNNDEDDEEDEEDDEEDVFIEDIIDDDDFVIIDIMTKKDIENVKTLIEKKKKGPKPKLIGKYSLAYDNIFKDKKNIVNEDEDESEYIIKNAGGSLDINDDFIGNELSNSDIDSHRNTELKKTIYDIITDKKLFDLQADIRKPSKININKFFKILLEELKDFGYSKSEIFIEFSEYCTKDKIWNIFILLDKEYSNDIINELKNKYMIDDLEKLDFI
jgi:hypothetical protein